MLLMITNLQDSNTTNNKAVGVNKATKIIKIKMKEKQVNNESWLTEVRLINF